MDFKTYYQEFPLGKTRVTLQFHKEKSYNKKNHSIHKKIKIPVSGNTGLCRETAKDSGEG
ncbi:MAG: hypothetical protein D3925_02215 [Candidatus Electrothrix sp. AR5]|nr:hypothetical protein [Candidatus Electrothrix sp. AR5]